MIPTIRCGIRVALLWVVVALPAMASAVSDRLQNVDPCPASRAAVVEGASDTKRCLRVSEFRNGLVCIEAATADGGPYRYAQLDSRGSVRAEWTSESGPAFGQLRLFQGKR